MQIYVFKYAQSDVSHIFWFSNFTTVCATRCVPSTLQTSNGLWRFLARADPHTQSKLLNIKNLSRPPIAHDTNRVAPDCCKHRMDFVDFWPGRVQTPTASSRTPFWHQKSYIHLWTSSRPPIAYDRIGVAPVLCKLRMDFDQSWPRQVQTPGTSSRAPIWPPRLHPHLGISP